MGFCRRFESIRPLRADSSKSGNYKGGERHRNEQASVQVVQSKIHIIKSNHGPLCIASEEASQSLYLNGAKKGNRH